MVLTLSSAELTELQACLQTILSPLSYETVGDWRTASREQVERLLGADMSAFILPMAGQPFINIHPHHRPAAAAYEQYFHTCDVVLTQRRQERGLEIYHRDMLYEPGEMAHDELHQDWCIPYRLHDTLGMGFQIDDGPFPAGIHSYHHHLGAPEFGERGVGLLQLLLPAFKAGVTSCVRLSQYRAALERMLDGITEALALLSLEGRILHANKPLMECLSGGLGEGRLREEMSRLARAVAELGRRRPGRSASMKLPVSGLREVRVGVACYRLRASLLAPGMGGPRGAVVVDVERVGGRPSSDMDLRLRFGLTPREVQVARLLAEGLSNAEVAQVLAISSHTAARHGERVRSKLGVRSRSAVGAAISRLTSRS